MKQIKCVGENLEDFIKYGDQIPYYRDFQGGPNPHSSKKVQEYYIMGKEFSGQFDKGEDFLEILRNHAKNCEGCSKTIEILINKYNSMTKEGLRKFSEQTKNNLRYFGLIK